jgi:hypothetical protein
MGAPLPETIDGVLTRLNGLLDDAIRDGRRIGYFVALYERVTSNVRHALIAGTVFDDNPRMERLDVVFANRFIEAWDLHVAGSSPTESWGVAFEMLENPGPLVIQHLMLGMNAHINLDLGIAAATVAPTPAQLEALHADFNPDQRRAGAAGEDRRGPAVDHLPAALALATASRWRRISLRLRMNASRDVAGSSPGAGGGPRDAWPGDHRAPRRAVAMPRARSIRCTASRPHGAGVQARVQDVRGTFSGGS